MLDNDAMPKDLANMSHAERMIAITRDMNSPASVSREDEALEIMIQEFLDILAVRKRAAMRHKINSSPPTLQVLQSDEGGTKPVETQTENDQRALGSTLAGLTDLIDRYRTDDESPFKNVRFATRRYYEKNAKRLITKHGDKPQNR